MKLLHTYNIKFIYLPLNPVALFLASVQMEKQTFCTTQPGLVLQIFSSCTKKFQIEACKAIWVLKTSPDCDLCIHIHVVICT